MSKLRLGVLALFALIIGYVFVARYSESETSVVAQRVPANTKDKTSTADKKGETPKNTDKQTKESPTNTPAVQAESILYTVDKPRSEKEILQHTHIPHLQAREAKLNTSWLYSLEAGKSYQMAFEPFPGQSWTLNLKAQQRPGDSSFYLTGEAKGEDVSVIRLSADGNSLLGTVTIGGKDFVIQSAGKDQNVYVIEVDKHAFPHSDEDEEVAKSKMESAPLPFDMLGSAGSGADSATAPPVTTGVMAGANPTGPKARILVLYTADAEQAANGQIQQEIKNEIDNVTNQIFANSAIGQVELAKAIKTSYVAHATDMVQDLRRLAMSDDGFMDDVHALRLEHQADIVLLYTAQYTNYCGIAYLGLNETNFYGFRYSFGISARSCNFKMTLAHELGHIYGADHDERNATAHSAKTARGFIDPSYQFRTIMAYENTCPNRNCPPVPYFSNTTAKYNNKATGSATANNAVTVNKMAPLNAKMLDGANTEFLTISPMWTVRKQGEKITYTVKAPTGADKYVWYRYDNSVATPKWESVATTTVPTFTETFVEGHPGSGVYYHVRAFSGSTPKGQSHATYIEILAGTNSTAPRITKELTPQEVFAGGTVTLSVTASGSGTLTYKWLFKGAEISGANTNSLKITSIQPAQEGDYSVVVSNSAGSAKSKAFVNVLGLPTIITQPVSATVKEGDTHKFVANGSGLQVTVQWYLNNIAISGATAGSYEIKKVGKAHAGDYHLLIKNPAGQIKSNIVKLTVTDAVIAPKITQNITAQTLAKGKTLTLKVTATGSAPQYKWYLAGAQIAGAVSNTLTLSNVQTNQAGVYKVVVSNSAGSVESSAKVDIFGPPTITKQPTGAKVKEGEATTLSTTVTGHQPTFQWYFKGAVVSGATQASYALSNIKLAQAGQYYLIAKNEAGETKSSVVQVDVSKKEGPKITQGLAVQAIAKGKSLTLKVTAEGEGTLQYKWYLAGVQIAGATTNTLTRANVQLNQSGDYKVVVSNSVGSVESIAKITVFDVPTITTHPADVSVKEGESVALKVTITGHEPKFQWYFKSAAIKDATSAVLSLDKIKANQAGEYYIIIKNDAGEVKSKVAKVTVAVAKAPTITQILTEQTLAKGSTLTLKVGAEGEGTLQYKWYLENQQITGATTNTLSRTNIQLNQAGAYKVTVSNGTGTVESTTKVTVFDIPVITAQPSDISTKEGETITLKATVTGYEPKFQWFFKGAAIKDATLTSLALTKIKMAQAGDYYLSVKNSAGEVKSKTVKVTVASAAAPKITQMLANTDIAKGKTLSLAVKAEGTGTLQYKWYVGTAIISGETKATLSRANIQLNQSGQYKVVVSNSNGSVDSAATVTVFDAPTFSTQPVAKSLSAGQALSLSAAVTGHKPQFQWYHAGKAVAGATTTTLSIAAVAASHAGEYYLIAKNEAGETKSTVVKVTVTSTPVKPVISTQPKGQKVKWRTPASFTVSVSSAETLKYQWFKRAKSAKDFVMVTGATSVDLKFTKAEWADAGTYKLKITGAFGTLESAEAGLELLSIERGEAPPDDKTIPVYDRTGGFEDVVPTVTSGGPV